MKNHKITPKFQRVSYQIRFLPVLLIVFSLSACNRQTADDSGWTKESLQMPDIYDNVNLPEPKSQGALLLSEYCSQCHATPSPSAHSASDWVPVFRRMILLMKKSSYKGQMGGMMMGRNRSMPMGMAGAEVPDPEQQQKILDYLQAHALNAVSPEKLPENQSKAATIFATQCSKCHALPSPDQHTASQWPGVVARMQEHLGQSHLPLIPQDDLNTIVAYLQKHAQVAK